MTNSSAECVIETEGLTKRYGPITAVDDLALRVPRDGVFGLLGPNGSGKTTTLSMLLGLVRPDGGTLRLFGEDVHHRHSRALRRVGAIVDGPAFYPGMSGRDNLRFFQMIGRGQGPGELDRVMETVGLSDRAGSEYHTYSMGMRQRLGIAYALLGDPELLFLDEPTNGLDPAGVVDVRNLIARLGGDGRTVVLCSHLLHEVEQVCDRVAILVHGRLLAEGSVRELLQQRGSVRVKTTDDARARAILSALDWVGGVDIADGALMVDAPPERSGELTRALASQEVYVTELVPVHLSLERFFLDVTDEHAAAKEIPE
jgi:ABC-2 type transport system ATP-binding protein